ncbi:MAG: response regulator [Pseudomonadota bacterium]
MTTNTDNQQDLPRVLLVDDSAINVTYLMEMLEERACIVDTARHGHQALDLFSPGRCALILMDCQMPVMDGFEATRLIRELESQSDAEPSRILAITANATPGIRERCLNSGMDGILIKPFMPDVFLEAVNLPPRTDH